MTETIPVVLAPGYMLDADLWTEFAAGLAAVGEPRFDIRYADLTRDTTIEAMAARLLAEAPETFVLIGFSMGGYVAREAVRMAPRRVAALVLIATSSEGDSAIQRARKEAMGGAFDPANFKGLSRSAVASSVAPAHEGGPLVDRIQAMGDRLGGHVFQRQSALVRTGDADRLGEIACPTLIVAGAEDRLRRPEEAQALHAGIAGSTLATIPGSGHMIPLEAPDALLGIVTPWLRGVLGGLTAG